MTTKTRPKRPKQRRVLADDACPICGTRMRRQGTGASLSVNGEQISVPDFPHLRCPKCREAVLSLAEARELQRRAIERYRAKYRLLSADQIRAIRNRHNLTQADLARLLRLGGNTISRWEAGRNVQTAAMDVLLRLIRDLPGSLEYLRAALRL
jgi:putative zinc finger/helix-turn-helix YgiT family protein